MNKLNELQQQIQKTQERTDLTEESCAALAELAECVKQCAALEDEGRREREAYWTSPQRKELMQRLFGTSTVH